MKQAIAKDVVLGLVYTMLFIGIFNMQYIGWWIGGIISSTTYFLVFSQLGAMLGGIGGIYAIVLLSNSAKFQGGETGFFDLKPLKFLEVIPMKTIKASDVFLIIVIVVFQFPLSNLLNEFGKSIFGNHTQSFGVLSEKTEFLMFMLALVIFGPILEELLIRGFVLHQFRSYNPVFAIIITTVTFSVMHGNSHQALYTLSSSIVYTIVTFATGSIFASILAHVIHNLIVSIFLYYPIEVMTNHWYIVVSCTITTIFLLYYILKKGEGTKCWVGGKTSLTFPFVYIITFTIFFVMKLLNYSLFIFCILTCMGLMVYKQISTGIKASEKKSYWI
ncbi:CPBP family intramembrane glutamic endopeptidase [Bacillus thuringiensis]|uniref:CPBP family intramembrane glutamic endopeptidase n=1 Tax=Bacillus thuringiensis TaxID=1428 RepID=UPI00148295D7|nr:CPBP family intramembrane glutamic endopeptidase [Bacillus thuringiensis]